MSEQPYRVLNPARARQLSTMRTEAHWAVQVAAAPGTAWLESEDHSHTNLAWHGALEAFVGREVDGLRAALRLPDLTWMVLDAAGEVIEATTAVDKTLRGGLIWMTERLAAHGARGGFLDVGEHREEIPEHPVSGNGRFTAAGALELAELSSWYANAALLLEEIRSEQAGWAEVRVWPHHFDLAMMLDLGEGRSVGVGLSPGDGGIDEPYLYVNGWPCPEDWQSTDRGALGQGRWTHSGWYGAVLEGHALPESGQAEVMRTFLAEAIERIRGEVGG